MPSNSTDLTINQNRLRPLCSAAKPSGKPPSWPLTVCHWLKQQKFHSRLCLPRPPHPLLCFCLGNRWISGRSAIRMAN